MGPHLWLYDGTGPYRPGEPLIYVGTHPAWDGIGIAWRNRRYLHIEAIGDFDRQRMPAAMEELYRFALQTVCGDRIPLEDCAGRQVDNPAQPLGLLFHRDGPGVTKQCPGATTEKSWFFPSMRHGSGVGAFGAGTCSSSAAPAGRPPPPRRPPGRRRRATGSSAASSRSGGATPTR